MTPTCEYCASIAQRYSMDSLKSNSFQIMGFDNMEHRILGKFSVYLKKTACTRGHLLKTLHYMRACLAYLMKPFPFSI
ncbi:hypothetical protein LWM68_37290 [Niabella sp. W65]|nr:hypothetical protein [Niabella sp. W65]MCH7367907.1 hypothetical protein [Niabella sp. W65]